LIREFTIFFRDNGTDLLKDLFEKSQYSFEDFYNWFNVSKIPKEQKLVNVERMVLRLLDSGIIQYEKGKEIYYLTQDAKNKAVELVNSGRIRYGIIHHLEKKLFSPQSLFNFTSLLNQRPFYVDLQNLIGENLLQVDFWKSIDNQYGQVLSYVRAEEYYEKVVQSKVKINPYYSHLGTIDDIKSDLENKAYNTTFKDFFVIKNHFKKCFDQQCLTCGKNVYNLIHAYVEKIKAELRNRSEYPVLMNYIKRFPYKKNVKSEEEVKFLQVKIDDLIQYDKKEFGISEKDTILTNLNAHLRTKAINIVHLNKLRLEKVQEYRANRKDRQLYFSNIEDAIEAYKKSIRNFYQELEPTLILESIDVKIGESISLDKKVFQKYSKSIRELGKEGEKRIYEGLKETYQSHPHIKPLWVNEEKESGMPYDILLSNANGEDEYIEVKTTHTEQRSFIMSETEFKFAMNNSDNYKLYLIVNIGSGPGSYKIIIDNFKQDYKNKLRTISKRLIYL